MVRIYYHRLKKVLKPPKKKKRRLIAIDETKNLRKEKRLIFVWAAIDVDTKERLAIWASEGRGSFEAYVFERSS